MMKTVFAAIALAAALQTGMAVAAPRLPALVDPPTGLSIPGKFVWFDLVTSEPLAARAFYGKVFGWSFQAVAGGNDYSVITAGGRPIGGVFQPVPTLDTPAGTRWLSFASVGEMSTALSRLERLGFTKIVGATQVPGRGQQAIVRDPQGAIVGLMHSSSGDPPDQPVAPGEFFWVDLYTTDTVAAAAAYSYVGYTVVPATEDKGERMLLESRGYARAGITPLPAGAHEAGWLPYVQVEDVAATLAAATAAGGKVLLAPDPALLDGNLAVIGDPFGGVIGVIHWTQTSATEEQP
jgi:predicted enzyme related to lactoylglutathione lyase